MNQAKAAAQAKYPVSKVIHSAITIFLMFLFGRVIPPFGGITEVGMNVLGVFLGVIYGYCTCEIAWPSILGFVAYGLSGAVTMKDGIQAMMGQSVVFQSICAFWLPALFPSSASANGSSAGLFPGRCSRASRSFTFGASWSSSAFPPS